MSSFVCFVGVVVYFARKSQCRPCVVGRSQDSLDEEMQDEDEYDTFDTQVSQSEESGFCDMPFG